MTSTTNTIGRIAAVVAGLGLMASSFAFAPVAKAQTSVQDQINQLMATIAALQAQLAASGTTTTMSFTKDLTVGSTGSDVTALQTALISGGFLKIAAPTGYFGPMTKAAVAAWQASKGITPAVGYFGPKSRAAFGGVSTTPGVPGVPMTGTGLKVMLSADSPSNAVLVPSQATGDLAHYTFSNPTSSEIKVTSLSFERIGVSTDSVLSNTYLFDGAMRITDPSGISNSKFSFNNPTGLFTVPAGGMKTISVRADIGSGAQGQQFGVQLNSVTSTGILDSSVSLPIKGYYQGASSATLTTVSFGTVTPTGVTLSPGNDTTVFQSTITVGSRGVLLKSIAFENRGSTGDADFQNLKLMVKGVQVGSTMTGTTNKKVTFDLSANPLAIASGNAEVRLVADVVGGSGSTFDFQVRRAIDAQFLDAQLMQPMVPGGSLSAAAANTVEGVDLTVSKAANSPSSTIPKDATNVKLGSFEFRAIGDDLKVEQITASTTISGSNVDLANGKVFLNGVQIGSTQDISETGTTFSFGSQMVLKRGTTAIVDIYADAKQADDTSFSGNPTVQVSVAVATADTEGVSSGDRLLTAISRVVGNTLTVSASTLSATKVGSYPNQNVVAGTDNFKLGTFTITAGANEGVTINTIAIAFAAAQSSTLTNLRLENASTHAAIGSTKGSVAGAASDNSFSPNGGIVLGASGSVTIDVFANVRAGANIGAISATTVTTSTGGPGSASGNTIVISGAATLQTITVVSSGTLSASVNTGGLPEDAIVVAGTTGQKVGSFNFLATNTDFTVNKVLVKVPTSSASAVSQIWLKDSSTGAVLNAGNAHQGFTLEASGGDPYSTSAFSNLNFVIPAGTAKAIDVYVDVAAMTTQNANLSGQVISVLLDGDEGFEAQDAVGTLDTTLTGSASDLSSDGTAVGTLLVRKSAPTLTTDATTAITAATVGGSGVVLGRFTVTADSHGAVDWGKVVFTVNKSAAVTLGATTTIQVYKSGGSTPIGGTFATSTTSTVSGLEMFTTAATSGQIEFRPTSAQTLSAGASQTYEVKSTIGGFSSGAFVSLSITSVSTSATTGNFATVAGTLGTAISTSVPSFAWSDWSDLSDHTTGAEDTATADWTNDYLVKGLTLNIGTRSMQ